MFDFYICPLCLYFNISSESTTTGGSYLLFIYYSCVNCYFLPFIYLFDYLFVYVCYLLVKLLGHSLFYLFICLFIFYNLGGSHFLLSLQPTTTGVILSLYFMVNVRREVGTVNGLIDWWSNMSWVGGWVWATSNITPHWWQKVILNFHFLIARHWWSSQYSCRPLWFPLICKAMDNIVQSCHYDGKYISTPKSWWGGIYIILIAQKIR